MNKRYIYVLVILAILIAVCVSEQVLLNKYLNNIETKVVALIEDVKDKEDINTQEIFDRVVDIENDWSSYETVLCFMVNMKDIEDIGIELTKMKIYVVENSASDFKASLALLLYFIDAYRGIMGISFENVF